MNTKKRDPAFIAEQVKFIRKMYSFTQENLADASGLTVRTIQKIESGRHIPDEQTLRSIGRTVQVDVSIFDKPSPEQVDRQRAELERARKRTVVVPITPIKFAHDFLGAFDMRHAFRFDTSAIDNDEALSIACGMGDWIRDFNDVWDECYMSQRLDYATQFVGLCEQVGEYGFTCFIGNHMQQLKEKDRSTLVFNVGLMTFLPTDQSGKLRYGLVQLEGGWECLEKDKIGGLTA